MKAADRPPVQPWQAPGAQYRPGARLASTPDYVHYLLDALLNGKQLYFHGCAVPADVEYRIRLARPVNALGTRSEKLPPVKPPEPVPEPVQAPVRCEVCSSTVGSPVQRQYTSALRVTTLTWRETECLQRAARGMSNKEIAQELFVSEDTVKTHMRRVMRKLGAKDRAHATAIALRRGLID